MTSRGILYTALILSIIFSLLAFAGIAFYFYWIYWWYDVMMHFFAGIIAGFATYWVLFCSRHFLSHLSLSLVAKMTVVVLCFLVVGVVWEALEYITGTAFPGGNYLYDTVSDIVLGVIGSVLAVIISERHTSNG